MAISKIVKIIISFGFLPNDACTLMGIGNRNWLELLIDLKCQDLYVLRLATREKSAMKVRILAVMQMAWKKLCNKCFCITDKKVNSVELPSIIYDVIRL